MIIRFYDRGKLTTLIHADPKTKTVKIQNFTDNIYNRAFGANLHPTWDDLYTMLEWHCVPRTRGHIKLYLESIGLTEYDPLEIVKRTKGRMGENDQWMEVLPDEEEASRLKNQCSEEEKDL